MSRQPAVVELAGGKSTRQRIWEAMRRAEADGPQTYSTETLSRLSKVEMEPVREYLKALAAAGIVVRAHEAREGARVKYYWALNRNAGVEAPRVRRDGSEVTQGRGTEALWAAMTALDTFTSSFAAEIANVKPSTAATYCGALGKAGYLDVIKPGKGTGKGGIATVWAVAQAHRAKPRAPMITRLKAIYDPNIHKLVRLEGADEAADQVERGEVVE